MKQLKLILAFLLTFGFHSSSNADGPGWTVESDVIRIVTVGNGGINVRLSPELNGCTSQSGYGPTYASVYPDHPGLNAIQANLLAAYIASIKVTLYFSDSTCKVAEIIIGGTHNGPAGS